MHCVPGHTQFSVVYNCGCDAIVIRLRCDCDITCQSTNDVVISPCFIMDRVESMPTFAKGQKVSILSFDQCSKSIRKSCFGDLGRLFMAAICNTAALYIFILWFLSIFFFSSPNLSGLRMDLHHTSTHGVALVRIYNAGLKCAAAARWKNKTQNPKMTQKTPSAHRRTTLSGYIFATKACIDNRKKTC